MNARANKRADADGGAVAPTSPVIEGGAAGASDLDKTIHQPVRLAIVSALAVNASLTFNSLKAMLQVSDGNLSVHARKLEDAGHIECSKGYDGRLPRTEYRLSKTGRVALERYLSHMESLIKAVRQG